MNIIYRRALPEDTAACIELRGRTRENAVSAEELAAVGVTLDSWRAGIDNGSLPGYVGRVDDELVGYCFGNRLSGEIVVLALLPDFEGKGIGRALLAMMGEEFKLRGFKRLFLGCSTDPKTRSYGFYRHLGWRSTGTRDANNDEVLEYFLT